MRDSKLSRRDMLRASTVLAAGAVFAEPLAAAAPEPVASENSDPCVSMV